MNAVIYTRVSTAEQTKNLSLSTQRSACKSYCRDHGHAVVAEFVEAGESAKTTDRPELRRLLEYCGDRKHDVGVLVVYNLSRLARNVGDHATLRVFLAKAGIKIRSVNEQVDDTAVGLLMENIISSFAQFENDSKAERTKAGMIAALKNGRWTHQAPIGYRTGSREGPSLIPDEAKVELIRGAFDLVAEGVTPAEALQRITGLGLRTRKGTPLPLSSFHRLLRNPLYAGRIEVSWGISAAGDFEAIVPEDVFDRVQKRLTGSTGKKVQRRSENPNFPLKAFVRCDKCDRGLTGSTSGGRSKKYSYYHCYRCRSVRVTRDRLDADFLALLERLRPTVGASRLFEAIVREVYAQRRTGAEKSSALAQRRKEELQRKLERLDDAFVYQQEIDNETYARMRAKVREELTSTETLSQHVHADGVDVEAALASSAKVLSRAKDLWQGATLDHRKRLQHALFPRGLAHNGKSFRTAVTCIAMKDLDSDEEDGSGLASPTGFEPVS